MARPRNSCVQVVKRFASEYQNTIASATGESMKHSAFSRVSRKDEQGGGNGHERSSLSRAHGSNGEFRDSPSADSARQIDGRRAG